MLHMVVEILRQKDVKVKRDRKHKFMIFDLLVYYWGVYMLKGILPCAKPLVSKTIDFYRPTSGSSVSEKVKGGRMETKGKTR